MVGCGADLSAASEQHHSSFVNRYDSAKHSLRASPAVLRQIYSYLGCSGASLAMSLSALKSLL